MLDKSITYIEFEMQRKEQQKLPERKLPEGYSFTYYQPGDDYDWQLIETSVGEFNNLIEAKTYFQKTFAPYPEEITKRMGFVKDPTGKKVATCTAWWTKEGKPQFHWLAVMPEAQRKGIAAFLAVKITNRLHDLYPEEPIFLHTQTWSHQAIRLYQRLGYEFVPGTKDFDKGKEILKNLGIESFNR